jgi:hypothetical protein
MRAFGRVGAITFLLRMTTGFLAQASESEHIRIQFSAPDNCPDQTAFERALRRRTTRYQLASEQEPARQFVVTITSSGAGALGRLAIQGMGADVSVRTVSGKSCDEVLSALALMTALAIDPDYRPTARPIPSRAAAPSGAGPGMPPASAARAATAPANPVDSPETRAIRKPDAQPELVRRQPEPARSITRAATPWGWSVGVQGDVTFRVPPTTGLGATAFVDAAALGEALFSPAVRAGLSVSQSDATLASGAGASFRWTTVLVEGCPVRIGRTVASVAFRPCLAMRAGLLRGQGENLDERAQTTNVWADLGALGRIQIAIFPLRRINFEVQDAGPGRATSTLYAVPHVGAVVGLGLAYEFR